MKKSVLIPYERYLHYKQLSDNLNRSKDGLQQPIADQLEIQQEDTTCKSVSDTTPDLPKLSCDTIAKLLPRKNGVKARALLHHIEAQPNISWNSDGELLIKDKRIADSHIVDILYDVLNDNNIDVVGADSFYDNSNIPDALIGNSRRKKSLVGGRQTLPPPGIPAKTPHSFKDWNDLWKAY